jgi:DNA-binding NtrC family response regulator
VKLRVLIIDDDSDIRNLLKTVLVSKGYEVTTLADPTEFPYFDNERCQCPPEKHCSDILIADIVMPKVNGIDFYKRLAGNGCYPLVKGNVAIMSGYLTIHYMNELNELGIHYFRKPLELNALYAWVEQCRARIEATR